MLWCLTGGIAAERPIPRSADEQPDSAADQAMTDKDKSASIAMMRVNYIGEIAAQALYRGQSVLAGDQSTKDFLQRAADEEIDHLRWCEAPSSETRRCSARRRHRSNGRRRAAAERRLLTTT